VSGVSWPGPAVDMALAGTRAFVADYSSGLQIIDVTDPTNPAIARSLDPASYATSVTVSGSHAYIEADTSPAQPELVRG